MRPRHGKDGTEGEDEYVDVRLKFIAHHHGNIQAKDVMVNDEKCLLFVV